MVRVVAPVLALVLVVLVDVFRVGVFRVGVFRVGVFRVGVAGGERLGVVSVRGVVGSPSEGREERGVGVAGPDGGERVEVVVVLVALVVSVVRAIGRARVVEVGFAMARVATVGAPPSAPAAAAASAAELSATAPADVALLPRRRRAELLLLARGFTRGRTRHPSRPTPRGSPHAAARRVVRRWRARRDDDIATDVPSRPRNHQRFWSLIALVSPLLVARRYPSDQTPIRPPSAAHHPARLTPASVARVSSPPRSSRTSRPSPAMSLAWSRAAGACALALSPADRLASSRRAPRPRVARARRSSVVVRAEVDQTLNPRVASLRESKTMALTDLARSMKESGLPVIGLAAGEPDFDTPDTIVQAGCDAIRGGFTRYSPNTGTASLRAAVCDKLERENGVAYAPNEIVLSNGAKQSVAQGVIATCGPGDEVLIPAPYWVSYPEMCRLAGAEPVVVPTTADEGFVLSAEKLRAALTPTRGF